MPGHSEHFPWPSYYDHFDFFEQQMGHHRRVASLTPEGNGVYLLVRDHGDKLRLFICECYAFGIAQYTETVRQLGELNAIIINSVWCGYTSKAKRHCRETRVGLFNIREFMAALHREDYWMYLTKNEQEYFARQGW